jgi:threonine dehydratase
MDVDRPAIALTEPLIRPYIRRTPVLTLDGADFGLDARITLKLEFLQHTGSFKARGAFANLLLRDVPPVGVVAASGGNHGVAVAYAAMRLGLPARIFVPEISSPAKIARIRGYGADLVVAGARYADALEMSEAWVVESGALPVHAFDQIETLLGAGTVGLEFEDQADGVDTVMVSVGGGGLLGGTAAWCGAMTRVVGVEPDGAPTLTMALEAGRPVDAPTEGIAADALAPRRVGELMFAIARRHVDAVVTVSDEAIRGAHQTLWDQVRIVAEPGGVAALAGLLAGRYVPSGGEHVGVVVSGANTVAVVFDR